MREKLPQIDFSGQVATITAMTFRRTPGDCFDRVARGMTIHITKYGRVVASLIPGPTVINKDGSWTGQKPLTMGLDLGGEYAH